MSALCLRRAFWHFPQPQACLHPIAVQCPCPAPNFHSGEKPYRDFPHLSRCAQRRLSGPDSHSLHARRPIGGTVPHRQTRASRARLCFAMPIPVDPPAIRHSGCAARFRYPQGSGSALPACPASAISASKGGLRRQRRRAQLHQLQKSGRRDSGRDNRSVPALTNPA